MFALMNFISSRAPPGNSGMTAATSNTSVSESFSESESFTVIISVSYTHLDVYKRQVLCGKTVLTSKSFFSFDRIEIEKERIMEKSRQ